MVAQRFIGESGYQALYDVLQRHSMLPGFTPLEIGQWVGEGRLSAERAVEILGVAVDEIEDLMTNSRERDA
ncbi:hypothetical protein [Rhizobium sp. 42MFCr.1]|uniref:hypothetical protein n=1 Tax=Rhizobium sp. 42MFCr.1 TaxID=1048680 RepID=UPI000381C623|nr:hypothetical protein [Rhizobium sp. 42MFCr.1]